MIMSTIIEFSDEEEVYALIETNEDPKKIEKLLDEYREMDEYYDIEGFLEWLRKEKGIEFKVIPTEADYRIYF